MMTGIQGIGSVLVGIVLGVSGGLPAGRISRPVARVLEVRGSIRAERADSADRELAVFGTVYEGERLVLAADSWLVLAFRAEGRLERIAGPAEVTVGVGGCVPEELVQPRALARDGGRPVQAAVQQLPPVTRGGATIVRSRPGETGRPPDLPPGVLGLPRPWFEPVPQTIVLAVRPVFDWQTLPGATGYVVCVADEAGELWSTQVAQPPVEYGGTQPLEPGQRYTWWVRVSEGPDQPGRRWGEARFTVAGGEQRALAEELQAWTAESQPGYLALAALWFQQEQLVGEAIQAARRLAELDPEQAEYHRLLAQLYQRAGRSDRADAARQRVRALTDKSEEAETGTRREELLRRLLPPDSKSWSRP